MLHAVKILRRLSIALGSLAVLLVIAAVVALRVTGAWSVLFPSHVHESEPPVLPPSLSEPAILLFTKTNSFRHTEAIEAGGFLVQQIAKRRGWSVFHTENGAVFNDEQLARFATVMFHNASGDTLDEGQEAAFERYLAAGGGWFGTHAAGDSSHEQYTWYIDTLIGGLFTAHTMGPQFQTARIDVEDKEHPATRNLPDTWEHVEEWYSWDANPRDAGFRVLATVDETTYTPTADFLGRRQDLRMGDHPILWSTCVGRGRAIYSALGHQGAAYGTREVQALTEGALAWTARVEGEGCGE